MWLTTFGLDINISRRGLGVDGEKRMLSSSMWRMPGICGPGGWVSVLLFFSHFP
jgi:hypothetical protein